MKFFYLARTGFGCLLSSFLFILLITGCQKDLLNEPGSNIVVPGTEATALAMANVSDYIVIAKSATLPSGFEGQLSAYGKIVKSLPQIGVVVVKPAVSDFQTKVSKLSQVQGVLPDYKARWIDPIKFDNEAIPEGVAGYEPYSWYQWGMDAIHAPEAWDAGYKGKNASVFILDSGIDPTHPDLAPNLNTTLSVSLNPDEPFVNDLNGHGTHVAGIIAAADNELGVIGVAPEAEIVAVKVLSGNGSGAFSWINAGIVYAADNGADIINMSMGALFYRNGFYIDDDGNLAKIPAAGIQSIILAQQRAVDYAYKKGAVIVTSAGNDAINFDGSGSLFKLPGGLAKVITVSATAPNYWYGDLVNGIIPNLDIPASYTDYGKSFVEVAAPGGDFDLYPNQFYFLDMVLSTYLEGDYAWMAGTSMAAPHVSGVAALIIGKNGGQMKPVDVITRLKKTADKIDGMGISPYFGHGRVNAFRAVQ